MLEIFSNPVSAGIAVAIILAVLAIMRAAGELLIKIGNLGKYAATENDWFDSIGAFLLHVADAAGKLLAFFGVGNRRK